MTSMMSTNSAGLLNGNLNWKSPRIASRWHVRRSRSQSVPGSQLTSRRIVPFKTLFHSQGPSRVVATAAAFVEETTMRSSLQKGLLSVKEHHRELRQKVVDCLPQGGIIYMEGGELVPRNGSDVFYDFRPDSNFFYLTGCSEPGFAAMIDTTTGRFTLLSAKVPNEMLHWVGALPSLDDLAEEYGADDCMYFEDAESAIRSSGAHTVHSLPGMVGHGALQAMKDLDLRPSDALLGPALGRCREFKTHSEVACLQHASNISSEAHLAVMRAAPTSSFEYELEAEFLRATRFGGLKHMGYPSIIGAGKNAAILHYCRNDAAISSNDVILMDAGAEYRCYTADITRTFPAGAKFVGEMADVYDAVLAIQEGALDKTVAGAYWSEISASCRTQLAGLLLDMGYVKGSVETIIEQEVDKLFMPHGLGHFLGLDVHDFGGSGLPIPDEKLEPGHVVTVEPGIYFVDSLLRPALADPEKANMLNAERITNMLNAGGVRIEDNVAITETGVVNLTNVPKARAAVEEIAAMNM